MKITGAQIRAARAWLRWTIADLAKKAKVSVPTIQAVERVDGTPAIEAGLEPTRKYRATARSASLDKIAEALTAAGITFLPEEGKGRGIRGRNTRQR